MKDGWEDWIDKRRWVKRDNKGKFINGNFHTSEKHKKAVSEGNKGRKVSNSTKEKIRNSLLGKKHSWQRKRKVSIATKEAMKKISYN
jgi:hypothetical protein